MSYRWLPPVPTVGGPARTVRLVFRLLCCLLLSLWPAALLHAAVSDQRLSGRVVRAQGAGRQPRRELGLAGRDMNTVVARRLPRLVVAGTHSGVGKTSVVLGLIAALRRQGLV